MADDPHDDDPFDDALLRALPTAHGVALRMARTGADDARIALALGIAPEAVPDLLVVAHRKLADLRRLG